MARTCLFVIRSLTHGGAQRQLVLLARALARRGYPVTVAVYYAADTALEAELMDSGVRLVNLHKRGTLDVAGFVKRLRALVRETRPDILHGYLTTGNAFAALAHRAHREARLVFGLRASRMDRGVSGTARLCQWLEGRLARRAHLAIANSHTGARDAIRRGFHPHRITVIHNGIDGERFQPDPAGARAFRAELGLAGDTPLIGLVGRLDPKKDHQALLQAATRLADIGVHVACVGDGPENRREQLRDVAGACGLQGRFHLLPGRAELNGVYSALDLLVLPSRFGEGFPNVVGEAMACGTRAVVTDCGDAALVAGPVGGVVPVGDIDALAVAIRTGLSGPAGADPRASILSRFGVEPLVHHTVAAFDRLPVSPGPVPDPRRPAIPGA